MATTEDYLEWLYDRVGLPKRGRNRSYYDLFCQLHTKEFVWVLLKDQSRADDGKELRWEFVQQAGLGQVPAAWMYASCSTLEMMVALAQRIASLTDRDIRFWFEQIMRNFGIYQHNDLNYRTVSGSSDDIDGKLESLVWRTYSTNGDGGLFPLKRPNENQRHVELWYQMNAWLLENQ